jgi:hypothetical protein
LPKYLQTWLIFIKIFKIKLCIKYCVYVLDMVVESLEFSVVVCGLLEIKLVERFDVVGWLWHNNVLPQKGWQQKNELKQIFNK